MQSLVDMKNWIWGLFFLQVTINTNSNLCDICNHDLKEQMLLITKGLTSLMSSSKILGKTDLSQYLQNILDKNNCYKRFK